MEVDNAFYRLPERAVFESWRIRTQEDFCVVVKASRYLTHIKGLCDPAEPVARLMERARGVGDKLGPILLQLPPTMHDAALLDDCLGCFLHDAGRTSYDVRLAVEPRHESWWAPEVRAVLECRGAELSLG